mmetsp:Transcript_29274/g.62215  ORF Transcript_29274/g.62215 Transcript_29274/m.62215 type:complete len:503 (+) Transcript_29274:54-1562(+)
MWLVIVAGIASFVVSVQALSLHTKRLSVENTFRDPIPSLAGCRGVECLERFVAFDDGAFAWQPIGRVERGRTRGVPWTSHSLELRSQAWMANDTDLAAWTHTMTVIVPNKLQLDSKQAGWTTLFVNEEAWLAQEMAARTGAVAVAVSDVPNQWLHFKSNGGLPMQEETLKAWSWTQFAKYPSHPEWPIEMPTAKAVVRAMDAVQAFFMEEGARLSHGPPPVMRFVLSGHSKRGIASYMAGAVDPRVAAIIPVSHPLDLDLGGKLSYENLGQTVTAALVYDQYGVKDISGETFVRLDSIIDPVNYMDRLTMPKLLMMCGGDGFFAPDSTRTWWPSLPSPKSFYMYANSGHAGYTEPGAGGPDFLDAADAFVSGLVLGEATPALDWSIDDATGRITVSQVSDHTPTSVRLWYSHTRDNRTRDFRNVHWDSHELPPLPDGDGRKWVAHMDPQEDGTWTAFFVAFSYPAPRPNGPEWRLTTENCVVPDVRPFAAAPPEQRANYVFR